MDLLHPPHTRIHSVWFIISPLAAAPIAAAG